jgi:hypothetical protein
MPAAAIPCDKCRAAAVGAVYEGVNQLLVWNCPPGQAELSKLTGKPRRRVRLDTAFKTK